MSSTPYRIEQIEVAGVPVYVLKDGQGREVHITPQGGFNAYAFRIQHGGETVKLFLEPKNEVEIAKGSFSWGYPILFPFAHRTREGKFVFEGENYQLDVNFKDGNAIHGLAYNRPWQVIDSGADAARGAYITASFDTRSFPDVLRQYPFEAVFTATYTLRDGALHFEGKAENVGDRTLPMTFGIHPWFPVPFAGNGPRGDFYLHLPANGRWEMEAHTGSGSEQLLPTGNILPVQGTEFDFRNGGTLKGQFIDDVFTQLDFEGEVHRAVMNDPSGIGIEMESSSAFRHFVVYAPLDQDIICLEPYTSGSDAANMLAKGVDEDLVALEPGETWTGTIVTRATVR